MKSFAFSNLFTHLLEITKASPPIRVTAAWQKTITQAKAPNLMVPSKSREKRVSKTREIPGGGVVGVVGSTRGCLVRFMAPAAEFACCNLPLAAVGAYGRSSVALVILAGFNAASSGA